jgi:integration host factor subunit beta
MKRKTGMNLPDLATKLAEKDNLTQREAEAAVKLIFRLFSDAMKKGDRIEIRGFGSFVLRDYKTYTGRNPKTGKKIEVRPKSSTYFKVGKELRERINGKGIMG